MIKSNPLNLKKDIFTESLKKYLKDNYNNFVFGFFKNYLYETLVSEHHATIVYSDLYNKIQQGKYNEYNNLENIEKTKIQNYFTKLIDDEHDHVRFLENLYYQVCNERLVGSDLETMKLTTTETLLSESLSNSLCRFFIGECYLWVTFYKIYQETDNTEYKNEFYRLLTDESNHNVALLKISKKLLSSESFDEKFYIDRVKSHLYWMNEFVDKEFKFYRSDKKIKKIVYNLVYQNDWHQNYRDLFLKKSYKLYSNFKPDIKIEEFIEKVYN